jgi:hypothetical protein
MDHVQVRGGPPKTLPAMAAVPRPALRFAAIEASLEFDTTTAFKYAAAQLGDSGLPGGWRDRFTGWPDSAGSQLARGDSVVLLRDEYVAAALLRVAKFAAYDQRTQRWAEAVLAQRDTVVCGTGCAEVHDRFKFAGGRIILDVLLSIT